jgi:hypothetical protein
MQTSKRLAARVLFAALVSLIALIAFSCDDSYGIYTNVQSEKKQVGTKVFRETVCTNAFRLGEYYYASTSAKLHRRSAVSGSTDWGDPISLGDSSSYTLRGAVLVGSSESGTIYALTGASSSDVKLYSSTDGSSWTEVSIPSAPATTSSYTFTLDALYSAGGHLYAEGNFYDTSSGAAVGINYYYLYYYSGSAWSVVNNFSQLSKAPIRGVVANAATTGATKYYFASTGQLYEGSAADGSDASSIIDNFTSLSSRPIWGLSYTGGQLYIGTKDDSSTSSTNEGGYLYRGDTAAAIKIDSSSRPITKVIQVPSSAGNLLLVGTDTDDVDVAAVGYYEGLYNDTFTSSSFVVGSTNHYVAYTSSIYSTTVSVFPVHEFYYDESTAYGDNLFVCISPGTTSTSYYGLYESTWNGSSWSGWDAQ